jgi:hypothetical protein
LSQFMMPSGGSCGKLEKDQLKLEIISHRSFQKISLTGKKK